MTRAGLKAFAHGVRLLETEALQHLSPRAIENTNAHAVFTPATVVLY
jgi:hypothetical protein